MISVIASSLILSGNPFFEHISIVAILLQVSSTFALFSISGIKYIENKAIATTTWNIKNTILWILNLSANAPNKGFATKPEIGNIVYIVPVKKGEKPNCFAIVGKNGTIGPVAEK